MGKSLNMARKFTLCDFKALSVTITSSHLTCSAEAQQEINGITAWSGLERTLKVIPIHTLPRAGTLPPSKSRQNIPSASSPKILHHHQIHRRIHKGSSSHEQGIWGTGKQTTEGSVTCCSEPTAVPEHFLHLHLHFTHQNMPLSLFPAPAASPTFPGGNQRSLCAGTENTPLSYKEKGEHPPNGCTSLNPWLGEQHQSSQLAKKKRLLLTRTKGSKLPNSSHI